MKPSIGILGGMGPLATADLFRKIVLMTKAGSDNEHIRIYIDNNPQIPDRTACILSGGEDPLPQMESALRHLESCGASVIIMPCNTAHYFLPRLQPLTGIPFLSILEETAKACAARFPGRTAGILGTKGTLRTKIYSDALDRQSVPSLIPTEDEQDALMDAIYSIKGGVHLTDPAPLQDVLNAMGRRGADYFILGCTELPIAAEELSLQGAFVDPTTELARAAIEHCGYQVVES